MMMGGGSQKEGVQLVLLMVAGPPSHTWPHHLHLHQTAGHVRPLHRLHCWQWEHSYPLQPSLLCVGETNRCAYHETVEYHSLSLTHCFSDLSFLILRMSMVNPRADPPIIKMMMSDRTPPTTEASSVLPLLAVEPAYESMYCKEVAAL